MCARTNNTEPVSYKPTFGILWERIFTFLSLMLLACFFVGDAYASYRNDWSPIFLLDTFVPDAETLPLTMLTAGLVFALFVCSWIIHELGHVLGYRLFDLGWHGAYFPPAVQAKESAKPGFQRFLVALLGPLTEIVFGSIMLVYMLTMSTVSFGSSVIYDAFMIASIGIVLNGVFAFILPLKKSDGAKIWQGVFEMLSQFGKYIINAVKQTRTSKVTSGI